MPTPCLTTGEVFHVFDLGRAGRPNVPASRPPSEED